MYKNFFGFKERPFQLLPNPAYLFLSRGHEEAMAHLIYAISQGDGFVEITGEVGTGKTTLCRAFLEKLDESTKAAYIFNPKLDSIQLLKAVNDEFSISSDADNSKDLIDTLNAFLMKKKAEGKKVILLIDEAQNLSKDVLEQIRLLSNLETTTSKLLQIILVGQPELGEMLDSHELRQLGQRITLSCHLSPLNHKETSEYIRHRVRIAAQKPGVHFTRGAFRSIYNYSGGVPRLINIACDRALLTAFGLNRHKITGNIARASIKELAARGDVKRLGLRARRRVILSLSMLCLALFIGFLYRGGYHKDMGTLFQNAERDKPEVTQHEQKEPEAPATAVAAQSTVENQMQEVTEPEPVVKQMSRLSEFFIGIDRRDSRRLALKAAMDLWHTGLEINEYLENIDDDEDFFRLGLRQNGLLMHRIKDHFNLVKNLNLPSILEFYPPGGLSARYLTITKVDGQKVVFKNGEENGMIEVELDEVESYWTGVAYIPWKNFLNYTGTVPLDAPMDSVVSIKMLIQEIGFDNIEISPFFDEETREAVKTIQERHGIRADGIVGPLTKIVLYNEKGSLNIPHIMHD
jgi:general secretion pathway protein A